MPWNRDGSAPAQSDKPPASLFKNSLRSWQAQWKASKAAPVTIAGSNARKLPASRS
jgi:hypothetical protein